MHPHMVPDEKRQIRWFIMGLRQPYYQVVSPQINVYHTYSTAVEAARIIEYGQKMKGNNSKKRGRDFEGKSTWYGESLWGFKRSSQGKISLVAPLASVQSTTNTLRCHGQSSTQQASTQFGRDKPKCNTCGNFHTRLCARGSNACYSCSQLATLRGISLS